MLEQFEASAEGIIEWHTADRPARDPTTLTQLEALWEEDRKLWTG